MTPKFCPKCGGNVVMARCMGCLWSDPTRPRQLYEGLIAEIRADARKQAGVSLKSPKPSYCVALIGVKGGLTSVCQWCGLSGDTE